MKGDEVEILHFRRGHEFRDLAQARPQAVMFLDQKTTPSSEKPRQHSSTTHCKDKDLSVSSNCHDGKGDGLFLSNGERTYPFPEDKLRNGDEVKLMN